MTETESDEIDIAEATDETAIDERPTPDSPRQLVEREVAGLKDLPQALSELATALGEIANRMGTLDDLSFTVDVPSGLMSLRAFRRAVRE